MSEQLKVVQDILLEAVEIADAREQAVFLSRACGVDLALRREVEELLQAEAEAGQFLPDIPGTNAAHAALADAAEELALHPGPLQVHLTEKPGDHIGRYKLLQKIGEGGCGVVYMAEQAEPVRRKVALKVIKVGMDTKSVVARFEAERQALALMDHANIARVLDAGATGTGRPFFVMELVRGTKITDYCDQNQLPTRERLELFIRVCQAVQHAHQKGIIHRDLKPSNILVTINDGVPVPKVI
ncbi:MAG: serine/threonine-protein kinase, partial [Verrucomicrobia bacterium]|nr:serine/threonine-protein kinase [Verrucomicrobiota bacterium]